MVCNSPLCSLMTAWFSRWVRESPPASFWSFSCPNTSWHTWQSERQTQVTHAEVTAPSGVPFNTFTELTFFPCLPSCSRTPLQSRPCRWSDARWSHSWSAEGGERSTETLTQTEEKHGLPLRDRKLWVDVPVWFRLLLRPTIWKSGCLFPDISGFGSSAGVFHWMEGIAKEPHGSLQTH